MAWTREQTEAALDRLDGMVEGMRVEYADPGDFIVAFAGEADHIADCASRDDCGLVHERISAMLQRCGMWEGDDEP